MYGGVETWYRRVVTSVGGASVMSKVGVQRAALDSDENQCHAGDCQTASKIGVSGQRGERAVSNTSDGVMCCSVGCRRQRAVLWMVLELSVERARKSMSASGVGSRRGQAMLNTGDASAVSKVGFGGRC